MTIHLRDLLPNRSSDLPGSQRGNAPYAIPIWSCFGRGLPCHICYQMRGAPLPHPFSLTCKQAVYSLLHSLSVLTPPGRYPASYSHEARTFLSRAKRKQPSNLSIRAQYDGKFNFLQLLARCATYPTETTRPDLACAPAIRLHDPKHAPKEYRT